MFDLLEILEQQNLYEKYFYTKFDFRYFFLVKFRKFFRMCRHGSTLAVVPLPKNSNTLTAKFMYAMLCFEKKESENIKERRKKFMLRDFSDKYDHALFKYQIKSLKFLIISLKNFKQIFNLICK